RYYALTIIASCFLLTAIGQSSIKSNTIYLELGGNALFTSINYERKLVKNTNLNLHVGTGVYGTYLSIPLGVNYLVPLKDPTAFSFIDFGLGATYSKADVKLYAIIDRKNPDYVQTNFWNYIPSIGYRKVTKRNLMYRLSLAPVINHNGMLPFAGVAIG